MAQLEEWYKSMPPVTRTYITASIVTTTACTLDLVPMIKLHMDWNSVIYRYQVWRLASNFFFFDSRLSVSFVFKMFFLYRYSKLLEINSFRGRTADYVYMLLFGAVLSLLLAIYVTTIYFYGGCLTTMIVYVWGRKNEHLALNFLGLFNFRAPYLVWVFLLFNIIFQGRYETDLAGIVIGHIYFYLTDVFPNMPGGVRLLKTPRILLRVLGNNDDFAAAEAAADEYDRQVGRRNVPGWGQGRNLAGGNGDEDHPHAD